MVELVWELENLDPRKVFKLTERNVKFELISRICVILENNFTSLRRISGNETLLTHINKHICFNVLMVLYSYFAQEQRLGYLIYDPCHEGTRFGFYFVLLSLFVTFCHLLPDR